MGETTLIEWTHHTFNGWVGCDKVSPGCKNCYAEVDAPARIHRGLGLEVWGANAARPIAADKYWLKPLAWNRAAEKAKERRRVFAFSQGDVFEDRPDLKAPRAKLFDLIAKTPNLDWLLLTKRPQHADRLLCEAMNAAHHEKVGGPWLKNIWLGTTVENQASADERIPHLLRTPAAMRFLSCEPLLERVRIITNAFGPCPHGRDPMERCDDHACERTCDMFAGSTWGEMMAARIDWVIIGGESGPKARVCHVDWIRSLVEQCKAAGVAPFVKQLGRRPVAREAHDLAGHVFAQLEAQETWPGVFPEEGLIWTPDHKKGGDPSEWPPELNIREIPANRTEP